MKIKSKSGKVSEALKKTPGKMTWQKANEATKNIKFKGGGCAGCGKTVKR